MDKKPRDVAAMFDGVALRYDLTNTVLSLAQDRRWRRRTRQCLELQPGQRVLDLAAGTGVSTAELRRAEVQAVACDFSLGMLQAGRANRHRRHVPFVAGDALHLPFADGAFDAATISFGLRNVADVPAALRELARVVRPGRAAGRLRVQPPALGAVPLRLPQLPDAGAAVDRPPGGRPTRTPTSISPSRSGAGRPSRELARMIAAAGWTTCATATSAAVSSRCTLPSGPDVTDVRPLGYRHRATPGRGTAAGTTDRSKERDDAWTTTT